MMTTHRFRNGLIVGKFAPLHHGHQGLIEAARRECKCVTVLVYSNPEFPEMPQPVRARWIRSLYQDVHVLLPESPPPNSADDLTHREFVRQFLAKLGLPVDAVFTSEDYGDGFAKHIGATHRMFDPGKGIHPVSGTRLRSDVHGCRALLDPVVYRHFVEKVVLLGAESTGKSTLASALADALSTSSVSEFGREYWESRNRSLTLDDYLTIAHEHRHIEDRMAGRANRFLVVDTNAMTTLFYSYYYNGWAHPELHRLADECADRYQHVYVCGDDIPFEQDGTRDNEQLRSKMQRMIVMDLVNRKIPFRILTGSVSQRIAAVLSDIQDGREATGAAAR